MPRMTWAIALAAALFAPRYLPGGNVYAGMLRAGTVTEQICTVAKSLVAALCMYLAPMRWRFTPRLLMGVSRSVCSTSGM